MGEAILMGNSVSQKVITESIKEAALQMYVNNIFEYFTDEILTYNTNNPEHKDGEVYTEWTPLLNDGVKRAKYIVNSNYENYVESPIHMYDRYQGDFDLVYNFGPVTLGPNTDPIKVMTCAYNYNTHNYATANNGGLYVKTVDGILYCALKMFVANNGSSINTKGPVNIKVEGSMSI